MKLPRLRLRERVASALDRSRLPRRALGLRRHTGWPFLTVITYHRIRDVANSGGFDDGVVDATASEFDRQLATLKQHFDFVRIADVQRWASGGSLPKHPVLLTFDDAYRECRDVALPILQRHGAPAAFFVSTQHVEKRRVFWWDRASYILKHATRTRATLPAFENLEIDLGDAARAEATTRRVLRFIKDRFALDIDAFLGALADACGVDWSSTFERTTADRLIASWDDVKALRDAGMEVHSHTRTHRVLQTLSPEEIADELRGSREELESVLREPVRALAYPTGRPIAARPDIARAVLDAGYDVAFENAGGVNRRFPTPSPLTLRRIPMAAGMSPERFETILLLPLLQ